LNINEVSKQDLAALLSIAIEAIKDEDIRDAIGNRMDISDDEMNRLKNRAEVALNSGPLYVIESVPPLGEERLYWSNDQGWVDLESATFFVEEEVEIVNLPLTGKWQAYKELASETTNA
jgi:hypothetical protein